MFEPVSPLHRGLDLRVQSLNDSVRHAGVQVAHDALPVALDRPRRSNHRLQPTMGRPVIPALQINDGPVRLAQFPEPGESQLDLISPRGLQIQTLQGLEPGFLTGGQVRRILQPQEPALLQGCVLRLFLPANRLHGHVHLGHHMEPVEHHQGLMEMRPDPVQVRIPHVAANDPDLGGINLPSLKIFDELIDDALFPALRQEHDPRGVQIAEGRHVDMPLAERELVDPQLLEAAQVDLAAGPLDVMAQDPPPSIGMLGGQLRNGRNRHLPRQGQDEKLEEQREAASRPSPGDLDLLDAARPAADPRNPGIEIGLVLKEVEMSPRPVLGVVDLAFRRVGTRGTGELRAFGEVEPEVQAALFLRELDLGDFPWLSQTQGEGKQAEFIHRGDSFHRNYRLGYYHVPRCSLNRLNPH